MEKVVKLSTSYVAIIINVIVATIISTIVGFVIFQYAGKNTYWYWWTGAILFVLVIISICIIAYQNYLSYDKYPYIKYRLKEKSERDQLIDKERRKYLVIDGILTFEVEQQGEAWKFKTNKGQSGQEGKTDYVIYGPYIILNKNKYRAIFRMKILNRPKRDYPIVEINVGLKTYYLGDKKLAGYNLTQSDFKKIDEYYEFPVDFYISSQAQDVEFRVMSAGIHGDETDKDRVSVVVDYVKLSRRLFC